MVDPVHSPPMAKQHKQLSRLATRTGDRGSTGLADLLFVLARVLHRESGQGDILRRPTPKP